MRGAAIIPTGPGDHELERLGDLIHALRTWVPGEAIVVLDDAPEPRAIAQRWPGVEVLRPPRTTATHSHDRMAVGSLTALRWLAGAPVDYMVKLDTDALVIGDYRPALHAALRARPDVGMWGAHTENEAGGAPRDFSYFERMLRHARLPVRPRRAGRLGIQLEQALAGQHGRARRFVVRAQREARRHGYRLGEHCLGGAYAIPRPAAVAMDDRGYLADPAAVTTLRLGEDVLVGLLTRASGFRLASLVAPGQPFAVKHLGLLAGPDELLRRRHAIIHSVKDHDGRTEAEVRAYFAARR